MFRRTAAAQYAVVRYKEDGQYGVTSSNWICDNGKRTYWPRNKANAFTWLKCRKWVVDMKRHFKTYEIDVIKYAGV